MKHVAMSTFAAALLGTGVMMAGSAQAGGPEPTCKISQGQLNMLEREDYERFLFVGASRNTNAGKGNGGEIAIFGYYCVDGIPGDDIEDIDIDANDLGGIIATDPGNSNQDNFPD